MNTCNTSRFHNITPLSLHNGFSVLQDLCTSADFTSERDENICHYNDTKQRSQERKCPPFLGTDSQSQLTSPKNFLFPGNKNKNGLSQGKNSSTKKENFINTKVATLSCVNDIEKHDKTRSPSSHALIQLHSEMMTDDHHNERKPSLQTTGAEFKSQLTCQEKLLSKGNKNGNGLSYGLDNGTSRSEYVKKAFRFY